MCGNIGLRFSFCLDDQGVLPAERLFAIMVFMQLKSESARLEEVVSVKSARLEEVMNARYGEMLWWARAEKGVEVERNVAQTTQ
jgi:hypothetical protein